MIIVHACTMIIVHAPIVFFAAERHVTKGREGGGGSGGRHGSHLFRNKKTLPLTIFVFVVFYLNLIVFRQFWWWCEVRNIFVCRMEVELWRNSVRGAIYGGFGISKTFVAYN